MTQDSIEGELNSLNIPSSPNLHDELTENHEARSEASDMQQRARILLDEIDQFQQYLREMKQEDAVYLKGFKSDVQQELKLLEKVTQSFLSRSLDLTRNSYRVQLSQMKRSYTLSDPLISHSLSN